jgi:hypothetical protein
MFGHSGKAHLRLGAYISPCYRARPSSWRDDPLNFHCHWARRTLFPAEQARIVQLLVERVEVHPDRVNVRLRTAGLTKLFDELHERASLTNGRRAA